MTRLAAAGRAVPLLLAALVLLTPAGARADSALYLSWNDCALGSEALQTFVFDCGSEAGAEELFCAFRMPLATGADVLGITAIVDIQSAATTLPDWWRLGATGECRSGSLGISGDFVLGAACADPWQGQAVSEIQAYNAGEPRGGVNQARIKAVCGVIPTLARTLDGTSVYYGLKLVIQNTHSTGAAACAGCLQPACLVLNSIEVKRLEGAPGGDLVLATPSPVNGNWARWQGGGVDCGLVPVRNLTWGRVKSLYR